MKTKTHSLNLFRTHKVHNNKVVGPFCLKLSVVFIVVICFTPFFSLMADVKVEDYNFAPAKKAIAELKTLPGSVNTIMSVINKTNFGPFPMSGSCGYNHAWYCLGMACKTSNWSWSPNFQWLQSKLKNIYVNVNQVSTQFNARFSPIKNWLLNTLPIFTAEFDAEKAKILANEAVVKAVNSTPAQIATAKADILASIKKITVSLNQGAGQLTNGTSSLSRFNQDLNRALNRVSGAKNYMDSMLSSSSAKLKKDIAGWPCGRGDITKKFNSAKSTVRSQFQKVENSAQKYGVVSSQTDNSVSVILGVVVATRFSYQSVHQSLESAKISPAGAIQSLRLNVASAAWRDLAKFAKQNLQ